MEAVDIQAVESKLSDVTVTAIPMPTTASSTHQQHNAHTSAATLATLHRQTVTGTPPPTSIAASTATTASNRDNGLTKYVQLLLAIEEMGREVRPTYAGSRSSAERLKRGIVQARILVRECLMETEKSGRQ